MQAPNTDLPPLPDLDFSDPDIRALYPLAVVLVDAIFPESRECLTPRKGKSEDADHESGNLHPSVER